VTVSDAAKGLLGAWGVIQRAVSDRASTAQIFADVRDFYASRGQAAPGGLWQGVNELRSIAVGHRNGAELFQRSSSETLFSAQMARPEINQREAGLQALFPEYLARFQMTFTGPDGEMQTATYSMRDSWRPGMTVGDVTDAVWESAAGMAARYGVELVDVDGIAPVAI